jgi:mRNA interferase RelE/StbE
MTWVITYHKDVEKDLKRVGSFAAKRILQAIDTKLTKAPLEFGNPLTGNLMPLRKLRVGDYRVVYQVMNHQVLVYVLAVGPRRDKEIYSTAGKRT